MLRIISLIDLKIVLKMSAMLNIIINVNPIVIEIKATKIFSNDIELKNYKLLKFIKTSVWVYQIYVYQEWWGGGHPSYHPDYLQYPLLSS